MGQDLRVHGKAGRRRAEITVDVREREQRAVEMIRLGSTYGAIAEELGYADESGARAAVKRSLARRTDPDVDIWREMETNRIVDLMRRLYDELGRDHVLVQFGRVVLTPTSGQSLRDYGAVVTIIREIRQLSGELSRLRGLHAPKRVVVEEIPTELVVAEAEKIMAQTRALEADMRERGIIGPTEVIDVEEVES